MADIERELGWDDEIVKDSDFVLIPEGDYNFTVTAFERGRHEGSDKLPPCNKAIVTLRVALPDGTTQDIKHNLFLHTKCEGLLSAFFTCIGQKRKGEPLRMNWNTVIGARGRCKISVRTWKNKDGEDMQSNDIKKFYAPDENAAPVQQTAPVQPNYAYQQPVQSQYQQTAPVQQPIQQPTPAPAQSGVFMPGKF